MEKIVVSRILPQYISRPVVAEDERLVPFLHHTRLDAGSFVELCDGERTVKGKVSTWNHGEEQCLDVHFTDHEV